jgi:hypothetical protein
MKTKLPPIKLGEENKDIIEAIRNLAPRLSDEDLAKATHFFREELSVRLVSANPEDIGYLRMVNSLESYLKQEIVQKDYILRCKLVEAGADGKICFVWEDGSPMMPDQVMPGAIRRLLLAENSVEQEQNDGDE